MVYRHFSPKNLSEVSTKRRANLIYSRADSATAKRSQHTTEKIFRKCVQNTVQKSYIVERASVYKTAFLFTVYTERNGQQTGNPLRNRKKSFASVLKNALPRHFKCNRSDGCKNSFASVYKNAPPIHFTVDRKANALSETPVKKFLQVSENATAKVPYIGKAGTDSRIGHTVNPAIRLSVPLRCG